jgi:hypothetical protein
MLLGDLDLERAETDPAYLAEIRSFLHSRPLRRPPAQNQQNSPTRRRRRPLFRGVNAAAVLAALAGPAALG